MTQKRHEDDCPLCAMMENDPNGEWVAWNDDVDTAAQEVSDLINAGKLEEAERAANFLLEDFPHEVDGFEMLARVLEARGEPEKAIKYYQQALDFMQAEPWFEPELSWAYRTKIDALRKRGSRHNCPD